MRGWRCRRSEREEEGTAWLAVIPVPGEMAVEFKLRQCLAGGRRQAAGGRRPATDHQPPATSYSYYRRVIRGELPTCSYVKPSPRSIRCAYA